MKYNKTTMIVTLVFTIIVTITINILYHNVPNKVPYLLAAIFNVGLGYIISDFTKEYNQILDLKKELWEVKFSIDLKSQPFYRNYKDVTSEGAKKQWLSQGYGAHKLLSITKILSTKFDNHGR